MKLKYDELLSNFAFNCNLRHYTVVEGGIAFSVAFGTLTAEEAVARLSPTAEDTGGIFECGTAADLIIAGAGFEAKPYTTFFIISIL